ncbi:MAG: hypothetical protein LKE55_09530 [Prevotella sp.]|jgi:hypothetical protein|nr:hypothetical protein [Prevotella sp.]
MADTIQDKINKQAKDSKSNTLWGKPANDIINGRDYSASAKPIRAIWEMVQNARDVSESESNIVFTRRNGTFEFKHDGMPFLNNTLNALILQTSAKMRNDGDSVGQYGTGFLTTHKFGRKFYLSGSLKLVDDEELYYNFPKLEVDRTPNNKEGMVESLEKQFEEKDSWLEEPTHRSKKPEKWTIFTYQQPNDIEGENVKEAFKQTPELIPYVLCLNEGVKSIKLQDEIENKSISFTRKSKEYKDETSIASMYSTPIIIKDSTKDETQTVNILTLESKKTVTTQKGDSKSMVTVILPIRNNKVYQLSDNIARLFIYLPLVGTEKWGINFLLQAPMFTCSTDNRSSLRLIKDGQTKNDPATENRKYIQEATDIIFDYLKQHIAEWQNVHYLAPIHFDVKNNELSSYYKTLKNNWLHKMRDLDIVSVKSAEKLLIKKPSCIYVLDAALAKAIKEKEEHLMPIYDVLTNMHKDAVPIPDLLVYWSDVFACWYEGETCNQIINISNIIGHITTNGMNAVNEADLLKICEYLRDSEQLSYFDKNILLTEDNTLTNKTEGYKSDTFCDKLKASIKVLIPEYTSKFVKDEFSDLIKHPTFSNKNINEALSLCTDALQTKVKNKYRYSKEYMGGLCSNANFDRKYP